MRQHGDRNIFPACMGAGGHYVFGHRNGVCDCLGFALSKTLAISTSGTVGSDVRTS